MSLTSYGHHQFVQVGVFVLRMFMDEYGAYSNAPDNKCAKKLLSKIKHVMWGTFTGWYLIYKYDMYSDEQDKLDMDLTPRQFVDKFNKALKR